ncbi:metal-sulfur cluster assembly factor [Micromonospora profundi]|uniref:Iron-sulfur cluster assembly protein n=1 Tax=Micromonospora profundi TaxID=1420889 RepID=A0AAJ6HSD5_9ACTN|nr:MULTISPECIES: iron-sulfur cluster assembly protein [Micromonospora]WLS45312.1 iron-sulfur cluster assembly protein [Micromonospora profundi]
MNAGEVGLAGLEPRLRQACNKVYDPCSLGVGRRLGIVDMGLVRDILVERASDGRLRATVDLITTGPFCMYTPFFEQSVKQEIGQLVPEIDDVDVNWGDSTDWSEAMMTDEGKAILRIGRSAPAAVAL